MNTELDIVGVSTTAHRYGGMLYVIHGKRLYQVDNNYFLEITQGTELYGNRMQRLKAAPAIPHSELMSVLSELMKTIKAICK